MRADAQGDNIVKTAILHPDRTIDNGSSPPVSRAQLCKAQRAEPTRGLLQKTGEWQ